jgi:hypothetical protein
MADPGMRKPVAGANASLKSAGSALTLANIRNVFAGFMSGGIKGFKDERNQLNIKAINAGLFAITGILTLYYINGVIVSLKKVNNVNLASFISAKDAPVAPSKEVSSLKPLSFYLDGLKKRDIFKMGQKSPLESAEVISSKAAEATQTLKLVGISWSDQPDVMIEDTKAAKTYFVKKGQMVGDFRVEAVYKDKVVLRYGAESIDLR